MLGGVVEKETAVLFRYSNLEKPKRSVPTPVARPRKKKVKRASLPRDGDADVNDSDNSFLKIFLLSLTSLNAHIVCFLIGLVHLNTFSVPLTNTTTQFNMVKACVLGASGGIGQVR